MIFNIGYHGELNKKGHFFDRRGDIQIFQVFSKNPRQFKIAYLSDALSAQIRHEIHERKYTVFTHASYLLNMANPDKWEEKVENGVCELVNAHKMGAVGTVFHVGKRLKLTVERGLDYMEQYIVEVLTRLYEKCPDHHVYYIIETSCGAGSELLHKVEDLGAFFARFSSPKYVSNPAIYGRVKLCIDTAHIFAAGWRLHGAEGTAETIAAIETHLKWENVACIHLNDSAKLFHSCVDRHANIGSGFIGTDLKYLLQTTLSLNIPHILETPQCDGDDHIIETHLREIAIIRSWLEESS